MHEAIAGQLWIGNAMEARDTRRLLDLGIAALIDLAIEELPPPLVREIIYCRIPLTDGGGNRPDQLSLAIATVASLLRGQIPCFVFCGAGMSRSPAIAAAACSIAKGCEADEMLQQIVADHPHDISPQLWSDVKLNIPAETTEGRR